MKTEQSKTRRRIVTGAIALGALLGSGAIANALTNPSTPATPAQVVGGSAAETPSTPVAGEDQSNNDPSHEAGETADHEAEETAGRGGHRHDGDGGDGGDHGGHSNTDAAHEAGESPERVAQETARDAQVGANDSSTAAK